MPGSLIVEAVDVVEDGDLRVATCLPRPPPQQLSLYRPEERLDSCVVIAVSLAAGFVAQIRYRPAFPFPRTDLSRRHCDRSNMSQQTASMVRVSQAQSAFGVHKSTLYQWANQNRIAIHRRGSMSFVDRAEVKNFIKGMGDHMADQLKKEQKK